MPRKPNTKKTNPISVEEKKRITQAKNLLKKHKFIIINTKQKRKQCSMQISEVCVNEHEEHNGRKLTSFYMNINNNLFNAEKVHICKDCITEYVIINNGDINMIRFKKILQLLDAPFLQKEFDSALNGKMATIGAYYKNIALNHLGECWLDGEYTKMDAMPDFVSKTPQEIRKFWGMGFEDDDYDFLEEEYSQWEKTHKCDTRSEITLIREICVVVLDIRKCRSGSLNKSAKDLRKELQDLMKTAAVDPAKANAISDGQTVDRFGVWLKDIEQKKPAEWHEEQEKYKDMDGFIPYIKNYIIRPIKNFFTGSKDFIINGEDFTMKKDVDGEGIPGKKG